jgi:multidrug efflux pump subunit AcrA (membrane-fusion protein)
MQKRGLITRPFFLLLINLVISSIFFHGYNYAQEPTVTPVPMPQTGTNGRTYVVQRGTVQETFVFSGIWLPRDQQTLAFEVGGTVDSINVLPNDVVTAGTLLASFSVDGIQAELEQAQAALDEATQNVNTTSNYSNVLRSQLDVADANLRYQRTVDDLPWTQLNSARIALEEAQDRLQFAKRDYNNAIGDPANLPVDIDNAYEAVKAAERGVQSAQNSYWAAAQSYNVYLYSIDIAQNSVIREEIALDVATNNINSNSQNDSLNQAQERVDQLLQQLNRSTLVAPFDGVVLDISVNRGEQVAALQPVLTLAIPEPLEVFSNLAVADAQRLTVGMIGICQVSNQPETAVQCIVRQNPLDGIQSVRIAASLDNVPMGQQIDVEMPIGSRENVLWLPTEAVRSFQNRTFVVVEAPDGERVVDITIGLRTRDRVEIISGLSEGDVVVGQ